MTINLTDPIFHDEDAAREHLEAIRWPNGPTCPHCGSVDGITRLAGQPHRAGLHQCNACRGHFTVTNGTVMERSHVPLHKWVLGFHLMAASKKGMSAHQLHRMLEVTYKTAWFMAHRIREAMREEAPRRLVAKARSLKRTRCTMANARRRRHAGKYLPPPVKKGNGPAGKREIIGLVERDGEGRMRHVNHITGKNLRDYVVTNASRKSRLHTDESQLYDRVGSEFAKHETVNHAAGEYARDDVTTNTVEGMFGIFKRGMTGVYQHCGEQHLQRYLDEFTFRWNNRSRLGVEDTQRAVMAILGAEGKRLTYGGPSSAKDA